MVDETNTEWDAKALQGAKTLQEALADNVATTANIHDGPAPTAAPEPLPAKPKRPRGRPRKVPPTSPPKAPCTTAEQPPQDYGQELILDIHDADHKVFTRSHIADFMERLCDNVLLMEREDLHFWDYEDEPELKAKQPAHLKGISAIQFIKTSNITIHTLDDLHKVFINIFSCKAFNPDAAERFTVEYFRGKAAQRLHTIRK